MLFFRFGEWPNDSSEPFNPFLVAYKSGPADAFILSESKLEVFFRRFKVSVKFKAYKLANQADFFAVFQALLKCIEKLLVFLPGDFAGETHRQTGISGLFEYFNQDGFSLYS